MEHSMPLDVLIIYGSVRRDRQGIKAARFILQTCLGRGHRATLVDPAEERLPLLDRMYKEYPPDQRPETLERLATRIREADAFIIVSGEYNHSIPPALSNLLDHFLEEYFWRPSGIVCYSAGAFGGVRAAMQLRAMLCELGTPSIPSLLPIPRVQDAFDDEGRPHDQEYHRRAARFLDELEWYANALKAARAGGVPY
jgi:NAD(P)H-dependent FMN reductase